MIKGIHHVSMKCSKGAQYEEVVRFYHDVLGLKIARIWGDRNAPEGIMFDTGSGIIEVFTNKEDNADTGIIRHFAFAADDVDRCISAVRNAGYEVFMEPKDVIIRSDPPLNARVAFCYGPLREQIEFFQVESKTPAIT